MSRSMTAEERRAFLSEGTRTAKVSVTLKSGEPHVSPVWFLLDGDDLLFTTPADSVKARVLRRDPRVAVCVDLQEQPFAFVAVRGTAELDEDPEAVRSWTERIGARYGAAPSGTDTGSGPAPDDAYHRPPGVLVRVRAQRTTAVSYDDE
ncbi:PPOX class F420-dependent oxidoreductase [Nocardiopsis sp. RSe5-2]|uniref:PPOX class F420-dependent oxidoreductase n=1 Tax=Nocardiopsis endophytica TaxID=3018445 RepID=A0ABT4UCL3_9ACTN|nr:PPOX class F420-dependent oxidoreductase [Nocardiopsis endophytica]MDA2814219.1 PPOX class F420-dependent oxidoreductase [Nocardiopsis endophytica]